MPGLQVSAFEEERKKKNHDQVCKEEVIFSMQRGAIMQKPSPPFDKDKRGVKGKRLTPLYRQWGQLCSCIRGYCYCCSQILLSPSAHMMNESPCNRSSRIVVFSAMNKKASFKLWPPLCLSVFFTFYRTGEKRSRSFPIHQLTRAGNKISKCHSQLLILSHHGICIETI